MTAAPSETYSAEDLAILHLVQAEFQYYKEDVTENLNNTTLLYDRLPDGMLSDIRDCFGHLCDAVTRTDQPEEKRRSNVENAHRHLRRVNLDCYKIQCIWYRDQLREFDRKYRWTNLSDVHDGKFQPEYLQKKKTARDAFKLAQRTECPGNNDRGEELERFEDDVYGLYEKALVAYTECLRYIVDARAAVERVAHKDTRRTVLTFFGWAFGIVMTIVTALVW